MAKCYMPPARWMEATPHHDSRHSYLTGDCCYTIGLSMVMQAVGPPGERLWIKFGAFPPVPPLAVKQVRRRLHWLGGSGCEGLL